MDPSLIKDLRVVIKDLYESNSPQSVVLNDISFALIQESNLCTLGPECLGSQETPFLLISKPVPKSDDPDDLFFKSAPSSLHTPIKSLYSETTKYANKSQSVDGSPLKLQMIADLTDISSPSSDVCPVVRRKNHKPQYKGIPLNMARTLISAFNLLSHETFLYSKDTKTKNFSSIKVLCDGNDRQRTACLDIEPLDIDEQQCLGLKLTTTTVKDPSTDDSDIVKLEKLNISGYDVMSEASYNVLGDVIDGDKATDYQASLLLVVRWNHLSSVPPSDARSVIKASVLPGDMKSAAYHLFEQLNMAKVFYQGLNTGFVDWKPEGRDQKSGMDCLKEMIEELKLGDAGRLNKHKEESNDELGNVLDSLMFKERLDLDFTDRLWIVLSNFTTYAMLLEGFNYVFKVLSNGELHPLVRPTNQTTMAQMVRESNVGRLRLPNLAGLYALQLLAEIGVEKLQKDYVYIFLSKSLVTVSNLESYLKPGLDISDRLNVLEKMHHVLEMVVLQKLMLQIPNLNLGYSAREMLKYYESAELDIKRQFTFNIPTSTIEHMFEVRSPCVLQVSLSKSVGELIESVVHLLTFSQPFLHLPVNKDVLLDPDISEKSRPYFYLKKKEIVSQIY